MFKYQKIHPYPLKVKGRDLKLAKCLYAQFAGPNGELGACIRYFAQSFTMPDERGKQLLIDIATEEISHVEMICSLINMLTKGASVKELEENGLSCQYVLNGNGIGVCSCDGTSFSSNGISITSNYQADLIEDMAAEEKARVTYEHLIDLTNDPYVIDALLFLRQREVVHYYLFKELLESYNNMKIEK